MNIVAFQEILASFIEFVRNNAAWAPYLIFILAFAESLAFLSLFVPATIMLLGIGVLMGEVNIPFIPVWLTASAGAFFGDWVSYIVGFKLKDRVAHIWPLTKHPDLLDRGHAFFERWGILGIFVSRFFGPLRAVAPLVAGICEMPLHHFQLVNLASAIVWGFFMLAPGAFGFQWMANYLHW